jgi:NO-binding membrane sensor protein with MHYT domain
MNTIAVSYDPTLIGLSYLISVFGAYTALQLAIGIPVAEGKSAIGWLIGAAFAMGGGAIWSMHFIGMLAYKLNIPVTYDPMITIISAILAIVVTGFGLFVVGRGSANSMNLVIGGFSTGIGVAGMHYTGMAAMIMPAELTYDPILLGLSVVIAVIAATVALWLAFNLRGNMQRFGSAFVMGAAVCGMHYTGMAAAILSPAREVANQSGSGVSAQQLGIFIFALSVILLSVMLIVGMSRSRQLLELAE